jgi:uncharacterized protein VirK/YbjX
LDECLNKFSSGSSIEKTAIFIAEIIVKRNYALKFNILDYIRQKFVGTYFTYLADKPNANLLKYERYKKIHSYYLNKNFPEEEVRSVYVKGLCTNLRDDYWLNRYDEIFVSMFFEICSSTFPGIFMEIAPPI